MERYEDKILKEKTERDRQQEKVDKLSAEFEKLRSRLAKEKEKLQELNDKIDRTEYFLFKTRLAEVGLEEDGAVDTLITVYKQHIDDVAEEN